MKDQNMHIFEGDNMNNVKVPLDEIKIRISKFQNALRQEGVDGVIIVQRADMFYFSGTMQTGFLYIPCEGKPILLVKKYIRRAKIDSPLNNIVEIKSVRDVPRLISDFYGTLPSVLGFEFDVLPVRDFYYYRKLFGTGSCVDVSPLIKKVRMIKSDWEIEILDRVADLSCRTFEYMRDHIRAGLTEMEFAGMFETFARKIGHGGKLRSRHYQDEAYAWHVLSGENSGKIGFLDAPVSGQGTSAAFPIGAGSRKFAPNEPIFIDFGFSFNGYHLDETRMFAIDTMPEPALQASKASIEIFNSVLEKMKPGVAVGELFSQAVLKAESIGYSDTFLGPVDYRVSFIGHGIGLEMVEPYIIAKGKDDLLESGMVFAVEPKMTFENRFGAGIESVVLVTETGARLISRAPADVFVC